MVIMNAKMVVAGFVFVCLQLVLISSTHFDHDWRNLGTPSRDAAAEQLREYKKTASKQSCIRTTFGTPVDSHTATLTVGPHGPVLLQDTNLLDLMMHFDEERIPERVVHAKGAGAFGYFEVTHDITQYTKAVVFSKIGKRTDIAVRFSVVAGERGAADTVRDVRGFAVKFYTEDGIWDLVGNNWPVFFVRDPILFPSLIHSQKRNPVTNLRDADMFWDFISLRPETTYQVMLRFSDGGIPYGYRNINGHGIHTFKLVNEEGEAFWCKFHYLTDQETTNLTSTLADEIAGVDPDFSTRDLYNAIHEGNFPTWTFFIQLMPLKDAETYRFNPFDATKEWPESDYPYIPVGKIVLNKNPSNYFTDVEQIAFAPSHMIPGIEPSPDKLLQARLFSYSDTHVHRLGPNNLQLPVNNPHRVKITNYQRDGDQAYYNQNGAPNYYPNSFSGPEVCPKARISPFYTYGTVDRYESGDDNNFEQPQILWREVLTEEERSRLVQNIVDSLQKAADFIQERTVNMFAEVDPIFATRIKDGLEYAKTNPNKVYKELN